MIWEQKQMSKFKFEPTPKFIRQLKKLPFDIQEKVKEKLKILQEDPSHSSLRTKRHNSSGYFESSINMNYRILWDFYMAVEKGCDVDKPRNLAKSVTVEQRSFSQNVVCFLLWYNNSKETATNVVVSQFRTKYLPHCKCNRSVAIFC